MSRWRAYRRAAVLSALIAVDAGSVLGAGSCAPAANCENGACTTAPPRSDASADRAVGSTFDAGPADDPTPGAHEICGNLVDDDADGTADEGCPCMPDDRRSCYGGPAAEVDQGVCRSGEQACVTEGEFATWGSCVGEIRASAEICDNDLDEDCDGAADDGCACVPTAELCSDGIDNDCNGLADDGCICTIGQEQSCYSGLPGELGAGGICQAGTMRCEAASDGGSRWSACVGETLPNPTEDCGNGEDDNCNGVTDCAEASCGTSAACCTPIDETFNVVLTPADVLLVVDASGSMNESLSGATRWQALRTATATVLPAVENILELGLLTYPVSAFWNCRVPSGPAIGVGLGNAAAINSSLSARSPGGGTPTGLALRTARDYLVLNDHGRPRFLLLATDGKPTCSGESSAAVASLIQSIRSTYGIDTFVLGIAATSEVGLHDALNSMAEAGGRARAGSTRYYPADSTESFTRALRGISAATNDCRYTLPRPTPPTAPVIVSQDSTTIVQDSANGWGYADSTHRTIEFYGASCQRLTEGYVAQIRVRTEC